MLNKRIFLVMFLLVFLFLVGCVPSAPPVDENQAPVIISVPITDAEVGVGYIYNVGATDPDEDSLIYSLIVKPNGMFINSITGLISWNPNSAQVGNNSVTVEVSDGELSDTQSFIIVVEEPCVPPCPPDPCDPPCPPTPQEVKLISIVAVPKTMTLFVGETEDIVSVTAHYNDGSSFVLDQPGYDYGNGSDDNSVATVSAAHLVEAVSVGEVTITVSYTEGGVTKTDTIEVTVNLILPEPEIGLIGITVLPETMSLIVGDSETIESVFAIYDIKAVDVPIPLSYCTFSVSPGGVVTVSENGVIAAVGVGAVEVEVEYLGMTDDIMVTVEVPKYTFNNSQLVSDGTVGDLVTTVAEDGDWMVWTFDFPVEQFTGDGNLNVGLIIALDGEGQGPAFQIHNNDGADATYPWGTWLMSPWGPSITNGWFGWHSDDINTPVTGLDWVEAIGERNTPWEGIVSGDGVMEIRILKSELGSAFHWAASPTVGSGFNAPAYDVTMQIPSAFDWAIPLVTMSIPNYIAR